VAIGELGLDFTYIVDEDREEYRNFCLHHLRSYGRPPVSEVWHYTSAEGLIGILQSGKVFSTQVTCLNDSMEQRYFGDLLYEAAQPLIAQNTDPHFGVFLELAKEGYLKRDFATAWHFVACFSEEADDLGQWRGYGGGECGYSIGFRCDGLLAALQKRPGGGLFAPMQYADQTHRFVVDDTLRIAKIFFDVGWQKRGVTDIKRWALEFLVAFFWQLDIFASTTKHPTFAPEKERRILVALQDNQHQELEFRQKRTLLARHLPIDLTVEVAGRKILPISRICVGPGPSQRVSQVSVGDLLLKHGYRDVPVELSKVPYRLP
jgi:hypothetical protein